MLSIVLRLKDLIRGLSQLTRVLCDKMVPSKLKDKFYRVIVRPILLCDSECLPIRKVE